jgi:hypothetical protein
LSGYLSRLFGVLNIETREESLPQYLKDFPYVNGGLFASDSVIPKFNKKSRAMLIDIGSLGWQEINPDIFGSMIQAVITPEHRGNMGMHYTSVLNIMKVIQPLFLDELYEEFEKSKQKKRKLQSLGVRISNLKIFDPACGSGNFLIIAYKELRKLEMTIFKQIDILARQKSFVFSEIRLSQFYGIELDDFAHEVAKLSLWLTEHQMNLEFYKEFGRTSPSLPLQSGGNIFHGNATRLDWEEVCPKEEDDEIYILGNPPFVGKKEQTVEQKHDIKNVFVKIKGIGVLDYVTTWYLKSAKFIKNTKHKVSFVSTNSIAQGEQVGILWEELFDNYHIKIHFAYPTFIWSNEAKRNASVHVVIIGFANFDIKNKYIYSASLKKKVKNINPYLLEGNDLIIKKRRKKISPYIPNISFGSIAIDSGFLILTNQEKNELIRKEPLAEKYISQYGGGAEFIKDIKRWCLWLVELIEDDLLKMPLVKERIENVRKFRESSNRVATNKLAEYSELFGENRQPKNNYILIPKVSSENRKYIPIGFMNKSHIANGSSLTIDNATIDIFGVLTSTIHMLWVKYTCGRMKSDYQYSNSIVYNNFPFPPITKKQKELLTEYAFNVLDAREQHSEKTFNPKINELNCDYILDNNTVIELKIIEEEPIGKKEKQKKFIELFPANAETVLLYPTKEQKRGYYKILESPIKKALKKASKQLQVSAKKVNAKIKIAIIMNNGLYMVSQKEFLEIALRRAKNDTSGIDILIVCSMHYYSDKFDMITLFEFKDFEINKVEYQNKKQIIDRLRNSWNKKVEQYMIKQLINKDLNRSKEPIQDLFFESNGIRYVKPLSQWGKTSKFWKSGRPREDSTKENDLPLILILPIFNNESYNYAKQYLINREILQNSLKDYMRWIEDNPIKSKNKIQLIVYIELMNKDLHRLYRLSVVPLVMAGIKLMHNLPI